MVAADNVVQLVVNKRGHTDVVGGLGVFCDHDVALPKRQTSNLRRSGTAARELHRLREPPVTIDVEVVAQAYVSFAWNDVLVDTAKHDGGNISQLDSPPRVRHRFPPA